MRERIASLLQNKRILLVAISFCFLVQVADCISSMGFNLFYEETNPFVRDALHRFVLSKGIVVKLIAFGTFGLLSTALFQAFKRYGEAAADFFASLPFWYWAVVVIEAVVTNVLLKMGYFVP